MFVFPAFDVNYKTRKRSFRCCQNCRIKKVKCEINSTNSDLCSNCRKHKWTCDLSKLGNTSADKQITDEVPQTSNTLENKSRGDNRVKRSQTVLIGKVNTSNTLHITPQYLKDKFNFNISGMGRTISYQYLVHGHPKAVMGNKMEDQSVWHESGVYIDDKSKPYLNTNNSYKNNSFKSEFHIRNRKTYDILLSLDAFTLSTNEYPLSNSEIRELLELYFYKINSLFPIVQEKKFWKEFDANEAPTIIVYAIVLVILRDKLAEPILKSMFARNREEGIQSNDFANDLTEFITDLEYKIRQVTIVLPQLGDIDKITLLVELLLLSFHYSFDRLGNELSSHDLTDAINLAVSSGIHMKSPHNKRAYKEDIEYTTNLWWCCYVLDRFNALTNSRCIFIKQEDFNIDLPYNNINLLKLVQLARSFENMTIAIYQPFDNNSLNNNNGKRDKLFNVDEFQRLEFEFCEKEKLNGNLLYDVKGLVDNGKIVKTDTSIEAYTTTCIHFLTRLLNNIIILISQKVKYDNNQISNSIPEAVALEASKNILRYVMQTKDETSLNIPLIPWCIALGMAVSLKKKAKYLLKIGNKNLDEDDCEFDLHNYITVLDQYSTKWWVVDEICKLTKDFVEKLNTSSTINKRHSDGEGSKNKRNKSRKQSNGVANYLSILEFSQGQTSVNISNNNTNNAAITYSTRTSNMRPNPIPSILNLLNENKEENVLTPFEFNNFIPNSNYIANNSDNNHTTSHVRPAGTPPFSDQYHDFLESMHVDLFDNDFLKDFPNIVNQLMDGK